MDRQHMMLKDQARSRAKSILSQSHSFRAMDKQDQYNLYKDIVNSEYENLTRQHGLSRQQATGGRDAKDMIPGRDAYQNQRIDQAGRLLGDFIREIDFPTFVKDLLKGVFDANLEVTLAQMEQYQELLKAAIAPLTKFVQGVTKADSLGYLVENSSDEFSIEFPDGNMEGEPLLMDKDGNVIDTEDTRIKPRILDAQIELAKERRTLLRETILMGISKLVVEKGTVRAAVIFDMKASEQMARQDQASSKRQSSQVSRKGGGFRNLWGGRRSKRYDRSTQITVASAQGVTNTELAAKLTGEVEIIFKSDYFKLDNFAQMYGGSTDEEKKEANQANS